MDIQSTSGSVLSAQARASCEGLLSVFYLVAQILIQASFVFQRLEISQPLWAPFKAKPLTLKYFFFFSSMPEAISLASTCHLLQSF